MVPQKPKEAKDYNLKQARQLEEIKRHLSVSIRATHPSLRFMYCRSFCYPVVPLKDRAVMLLGENIYRILINFDCDYRKVMQIA